MREVIHGVRDMAHGGPGSGAASRQRSPERVVRVTKRTAGNIGLARTDSHRDKRKPGSREGEKAKAEDKDSSVGSADLLKAETELLQADSRPPTALSDPGPAAAAGLVDETADSPTTNIADKENINPADDEEVFASSQLQGAVGKTDPAVAVSDFAATGSDAS